jgi:hypothetical protein
MRIATTKYKKVFQHRKRGDLREISPLCCGFKSQLPHHPIHLFYDDERTGIGDFVDVWFIAFKTIVSIVFLMLLGLRGVGLMEREARMYSNYIRL